MIICVHEDRLDHIVGFKLTLLSILHHCPDLTIVASFPSLPPSLRSWIKALHTVKLVDDPKLRNLRWNVKPTLLLYCLSEGYSDVVWIDADIIINRNFKQLFSHLDDQTMVVAQEYYWGPQQGGNQRTITWKLKPGRSLPATANSGVLRVTPFHVELLEAWQVLLNHPAYQLAQSKPTNDRPLAMVSDQEVLTALLACEQFSHIPVEMLQRGTDIAQCFKMAGYTPIERIIGSIQAPPFFIHAMGNKPWTRAASPQTLWQTEQKLGQKIQGYYNYIHQELTPYVSVARQYQNKLDEDVEWLNIKSIVAKFFVILFLGHPILQELPLSSLESVSRRIRRILDGEQDKYQSDILLDSSPLDNS